MAGANSLGCVGLCYLKKTNAPSKIKRGNTFNVCVPDGEFTRIVAQVESKTLADVLLKHLVSST
jgi:hypothetical protein